ncbi:MULTISPECIES: hypothetical protein [Polyangium]|uniref:Uncharacterized protein n=2 Tax=Polyangium TaxID=55 RepID=A0A4U1JMN5_9BACT|nr:MULTISPECIES: hypothetical protein [Polyangium]MDI1431728.1 hypothetical protein [Polyangium sorediatum]TKD13278.1 hypothetical protein E8A74_01645 [Polyangium fumosum]
MAFDRPTPVSFHAPTVLAVGLPPDTLTRAGVVLEPSGVGLRESNLLDLRSDSAQYRPLVLLVDAELYDFDPEAFDMVAKDVGAKLGVAGSPREAEVTLGQLLAAVARKSAFPPPPPSSADAATDKWDFSEVVAAVAAAERRK